MKVSIGFVSISGYFHENILKFYIQLDLSQLAVISIQNSEQNFDHSHVKTQDFTIATALISCLLVKIYNDQSIV